MKPITLLYDAMQIGYRHFNNDLFAGKLPEVIFTSQHQRGVMIYFSPNRLASVDGKKCHELVINQQSISGATLIELLERLVHEMVHCWQTNYGEPAGGCYHNKEWADKMIEIGLMPSDTGKPNGKVTGQKIFHYPIIDGEFILSCERLLSNQKFIQSLSLKSSSNHVFSSIEADHSELIASACIKETSIALLLNVIAEKVNFNVAMLAKKKVKVKYSCSSCKINVWGKTGLLLKCNSCNLDLIEN